MQTVTTSDGKTFAQTDCKLIGSVPRIHSRAVSRPAVIGEFPVFVEQSGSYRMFTYSKRIKSIEECDQ